MSNLIKINNQDLKAKEFKGQRVVTFKDIDILHERVEGTASRNFRENKFKADGKTERFIEGEDYFFINKKEVGADFVETFGFDKFAPSGILITESGYLMIVKSLQDDLAWIVQRQLVNSYFKVKENINSKPDIIDQIEALQLMNNQIGAVIGTLGKIGTRVNKLEEEDYIKPFQKKELIGARSKKVFEITGGKNSEAYQNKSFRSRIYQDIFRNIKNIYNVNEYDAIPKQKFGEAMKLIKEYQLPLQLKYELQRIGEQVKINEEVI